MKALNDDRLPGSNGTESRVPVLGDGEFSRRCSLLEELQVRLRASGAQCVLARRQRLVLSSAAGGGRSGRTDPELHIFGPGEDSAEKARTDGTVFRLDSGEEFPVSDPDLAAARIGQSLGCPTGAPGDFPP